MFVDKNLLLNPVFECDGVRYLRISDTQAVVLRHIAGTPIDGFHPGWAPVSVYTGLGCMLLLTLQREGLYSTWMVTPDGRRLGDKLVDLQPDQREKLRDAVIFQDLTRHRALIGNGIQFIEPLLLDEILNLAASTSGKVETLSAAPISHRGLALLGAPQGMTTHLHYRPDNQATVAQALVLQDGWVVDDAGLCRAVGIRSIARGGMVPPSSRHLLTLTLAPTKTASGTHTSKVPIEIIVNGCTIGRAWLDPHWQQDGADLAYWLPPALVANKPFEIIFEHSQDFILVLLKLAHTDALPEDILDPAELMLRFENIGDNCEFGLVQRHFEAHPIGLLRFAGLRNPRRLIQLLEADFGQFGEPGSLDVSIVGGEYWIVNHLYGIAYHTFRYQHEIAVDEVIRENEVKVSYLKQKLREDLEDGEKILVYKRVVTRDPHEIIALHAALNRFGKINKLLWVTEADERHAPGDVEWIGEKLLKGYIGTISLTNAHDFDPETWLQLCRNAYAVFEAAKDRLSA